MTSSPSWGHSLERAQGSDQAAPAILLGTNPPRLYLSREITSALSPNREGHICMHNSQPGATNTRSTEAGQGGLGDKESPRTGTDTNKPT